MTTILITPGLIPVSKKGLKEAGVPRISDDPVDQVSLVTMKYNEDETNV